MALGLVLLLGACGQAPVRQRPASSATTGKASVPVVPVTPAAVRLQQACAPTRQHRDSDYTRGGLYAPGVSDSAPSTAIDISGVIEPTPRGEPLAHYGNRTPYTVLGHSYHVLASANGYAAKGIASW